MKKSGGILTCFPQVRPSLERNDMWVVCWVWQILHVPVYDKRLSEDEGEWSDEDEENELEELLFKRINMWYHDAFYYFLSIYVRFGQFIFGPVKFSYVLAQMACKFQIPSHWLDYLYPNIQQESGSFDMHNSIHTKIKISKFKQDNIMGLFKCRIAF